MCKSEEDDNYHFFLCCKVMRLEFDLFSQNYSHSLKLKKQLKLMSLLILSVI